jgi:arylsulfatase A-like enzyme
MSRVALTVAAACALALAAPARAQDGPPNVVLIITDDMGYGDLGSYGSPDLQTPSIDSLATDGIRLTDFYSNGVLCSPTRAGLLTGRYQQRYGIESALGSAPMSQGLIVTGDSLPQLMKNTGYATGLFGKWHLGMIDEHSPGAQGFDYFFGFRGAYLDFYQHDRGSANPDLWENDTRIERNGYLTDLITEETVNFIERNADRPFFIDVSYNAPHWPYQPPDMPSVSRNNAQHLQPHSDDTSTRADYVAMVERVDDGVGEILAALERLDLADNTVVIFTNDNGGEWLARNGPLFHRKWTVWEGGIRVPTLVRWPGRIPAGRVSDQVGITMDLTATVLAAAGVSGPDDAEGMDLMPIWSGEAPEVARTLYWRTTVGGQNQRAVRSGDWKLVVDGNATFVFNLRNDAGERHDMANLRQDVAARLRLMVNDWVTEVEAEAVERGLREPARGRGAGPQGRGAGRGGQ